MGDDEKRQILRMVAEGKLSPEEAVGLLEAVDDGQGRRESPPPGPAAVDSMPRHPRRPLSKRALIIQIKEGGDNKVNLRIPLALAGAAGKFIPRKVQEHLNGYEIDLQDFLASGASDVEGGVILEVKDADNRVLIAVE